MTYCTFRGQGTLWIIKYIHVCYNDLLYLQGPGHPMNNQVHPCMLQWPTVPSGARAWIIHPMLQWPTVPSSSTSMYATMTYCTFRGQGTLWIIKYIHVCYNDLLYLQGPGHPMNNQVHPCMLQWPTVPSGASTLWIIKYIPMNLQGPGQPMNNQVHPCMLQWPTVPSGARAPYE